MPDENKYFIHIDYYKDYIDYSIIYIIVDAETVKYHVAFKYRYYFVLPTPVLPSTEMIKYHIDYRIVYKETERESRWRNVEVAFTVDRPKVWGIEEKDFMREADEIFRRFIAETTFTVFPETYIGGGFERIEMSTVESNTFRLELEYSDYDYEKYFTRIVLIKNIMDLWNTEEHKAFWDELSRQLRDIVADEFKWGSKRPTGISGGGRPRGSSLV
jgi:hypothetical protein